MLDALYLAQIDSQADAAVQVPLQEIHQPGLIHTKVSGKYEIVAELPKEADNFDNIFTYADAYGKIRLAYLNDVHKASASALKEEKHASALGGIMGIKTAAYEGFSFNIA
ncbi:MAG: porin, partial [Sulfurimonas sp.]|nr:porin [Sulfurimonas sp.]